MQSPSDGSYRGKLIFAYPKEAYESIRLDQLARVREPVSRSKTGVQGKVADVFSGRSRHAESLTELQAFRIVLATARADAWQEQPFMLEYRHEEKKHRYTPDLLLLWGARCEVAEIKTDAEAALPENQARFAFIGELLSEYGYRFRLWKGSEICAEPRLSNVSLILRYRSVEVSAVECEKVRRAFSATAEVSLRALAETAGITVQSVLRLVLDGTLHIDWWEPLSLESRVSYSRIGRQVWPSPLPET